MALTKATYGMISADTSTIDLNIDANTLYVDSSANRVGIGTNSPSNTLHVVGGFNLSGNIFVGTNVLATDVTNGRVGIGTTSPSVPLDVSGHVRFGDGGTAVAVDLNATDRAVIKINGTEKLRIDSGGKVGIATSTNHAGSALGYMLTIDSAGASGSILEAHRTGNSRLEIYQNSTGGNYIDSLGTTAFTAFATGGTERMRINSSGDVAIGSTSTPAAIKLYVNGAMRVDGAEGVAAKKIRSSYFSNSQNLTLETHSSSKIVMSTGGVGISTSSVLSGVKLDVRSGNIHVGAYGATGNKFGVRYSSDDGSSHWYTYSATGGELVFGRSGVIGDSEKIRFDASGNVGIGTTNPSYKLDVYGTDDITMRIHRPSSGLGLTDTCGIGFSQRGDANTSTSDTRAGIFSTYNGSLHLCTEPGGNLNSNPVDHAALSIVGTDQNVGIGTTSPNHPLSVSAANAKIVAHSTADSQTIGFHAKYLDHATLYGSFEYTTGDAQLYIDNHFAGNNAAYSTINFRNCNNNNNTLQTRMSIAGSTGMVTVNNRLRVANAGTATAGTVALEVLGNRNDSVVPANASAKFYAYSDGDGLALGNYTSSPYGSYLQAGYLLDSYGTAYNNGYPITLNPVGGNVGIGACGKDPLDILHIERSVNGAVQIQVDNQNTGNASYAGLYLNGQGNSFYLKNWGDSVSGKSNVTEFNTTASNQYMIFTPGNTHTLSLFNDESEFGSATADSKVTINPPNTSNAKTKTPTVIGFYHYYKTNPGANYAHMKTNFPTGGNTGTFGMIAIEATGYRYSSAQTIKGMWGFHNWNSGTYQSTAENLISSGGHDFCHSTYVSSDGYIVLVAAAGGAGNQYVGARLDFIDIQADYARHGTAYWPPAVTAISWSNNTTGVY